MTVRYRNLGLLKVRARFIQSCNLLFFRVSHRILHKYDAFVFNLQWSVV